MNKLLSPDIILIEDNVNDADLTLRALGKKNLNSNVKHFENGAEALDFILGQEKHINSIVRKYPKLIYLDLKLPGLSGKKILKLIKENTKTKAIPVVILTSSNHHNDVEDCYNLGANAYIVKPLDFESYMTFVSEAAYFWLNINYMPDEFN